jgi:predicted transcriptional regulator
MDRNSIQVLFIVLFLLTCTIPMATASNATNSATASEHSVAIIDPCVDLGIIGVGCDDDDDRDNHEDDGDQDQREDTDDGDRDDHEDGDDENAREGVPTEGETETKTPPPSEPTVQTIAPTVPAPTPTQTYDANAPIEETTKRETDRQRKTETAIANPTANPIEQSTSETPAQEPTEPSTPSTPSEPSETSKTSQTAQQLRSQTPAATVTTPTDTNTQTAVASGFAAQPTTSGTDVTDRTSTQTRYTDTTSNAPTTRDTDTRNTSTPRNTATTVEEAETEIGTTTPPPTETTKTTQQQSQSQTPINASGLPIDADGDSNSSDPTQWLWTLLGVFGAIGASTVTLGIVFAQHGTLGGYRARETGQHVLDQLLDAANRYWFAIIGRARDDEWLFSNDNRARVYETVRVRPGETAATLADATDMSRSTARHHANMLSKAGKFKDDKRYGSKRYFSSESESLGEPGRRLVAALRNDSTAAIITAVRDADSRLTVSALAETIDREQNTVSRQLDQLEDDEIVGCEQVGQAKFVALTERSSKLLQQESIRQFCW